MNPEQLRKRLSTIIRLLKKHPDVTVVYAKLGPKLKPEKLDQLLSRTGLAVSPETHAVMCAVNGLELRWYRTSAAESLDQYAEFARLMEEHHAKAGRPVGHIRIPSWNTVLRDKSTDRANFAPHHRALDYFYNASTLADDLFRLIDLDVDPALGDPLVRFGDDYGADYTASMPFTVGAYLDLLAGTLGTGRTAVMHRVAGSGYPVVSELGALSAWDPEAVLARVIDGDAAEQVRWDAGVIALHAAHPAS